MDVEFYFGRRHVPAFGSWDCNYDLPFTQCFESATDKYSKPVEHDLYSNTSHNKGYGKEKQDWICDCELKNRTETRTRRAPKPKPKPKAVDEDLYKISPHLLHQHVKRKRGLGAIFSSCLCPTCGVC